MDAEPHITLDIPDREVFGESAAPISVPHNVVYSTIDVLLGCLPQWRAEAYSQPDEEAWAALMMAASQALAGLMGTYAANCAQESERRLKRLRERTDQREAH